MKRLSLKSRANFKDLLDRADLADDCPTKVDKDGKYIRTPLVLCEEIVQQIMIECGNLSDKKILVVDTVEFIPVLLTFNAIGRNIKYVAPYNFKGKIAEAMGVDVIRDSIITWNTEMKFDVVVGNPPYNDSTKGNIPIYHSFIQKARDISEIVAMIVPSGCSMSDARNGNIARSLLFTPSTTVVKFLPSGIFNADVKTLYFIFNNLRTGLTTIDTNGERFDVDAGESRYIFINKLLYGILIKCGTADAANSWLKFDRRESNKEDDSIRVKTVTRLTRSEITHDITGTVDPGLHHHRVATSFMSNSINHLDVMWYIPPGVAIKKGYTSTRVPDESTGRNLANYLKSKLCRFIYNNTKTSRSLRSPQLKFIPVVDLSRSWTDQELYAHFGLIQEEIDYIEETIK